MSTNCNNNCSSCQENCDRRQSDVAKVPTNAKSTIRKVIAVISGKGGVGKSLVTSLLAVKARRDGQKVAIMDADITGPSIPKTFHLEGMAESDDEYIYPVETKTGIRVMSINLLLEDETKPVIWRGPVIGGAVKQFWTDVVWSDVDTMFIDCPPGTGDVPLTLFQSLPIDGIIVVTTPQELVQTIVAKACNMAEMMNVPVLGIVENMSYYVCDSCQTRHYIFGESQVEKVAKEFNIPKTVRLPIDKSIREYVDNGDIESYNGNWMEEISKLI